MQDRLAMYNANALKIGLFGANCSSGRSATTVPERWSASWPDCLRLARLADDAGIDFMLPIARWKGYGGDTDFHGTTLETVTWASGLLAATERITVFGTVHAPLFHPIIAAKQCVTADHIGEGRFGLNIVVKRAMDIALSLAAMILLSPVLFVLGLVVKLTSPGPMFYKQERCGLNGRPFQMLKFRSMRVDAENHTGAVWAQKDDPRRTFLGSFMRRASLDELPQLWNVLKGDMSLVGPRPERPVFISKFSKTIPNYMVRHCVKSGITGWAQVHGWRGNTSLRKRIQYDLYYITHWTPWLDIRILWMTIFHGIFHRNAY